MIFQKVPDSAKHILLLLLMVVVGGAVLNQQAIPQAQLSDSTTINTAKQCQLIPSNTVASKDHHQHVDHSSESHATDTQPKTITSCNSLMNILPAENDFSFNPEEQKLDITIHNVLLSSQTFVFREPDPPRFG